MLDFDPYIHPPEYDLTSGRGLLLLELNRRWQTVPRPWYSRACEIFLGDNPLAWLFRAFLFTAALVLLWPVVSTVFL